jgi:hypothetical protein
MLLGHGGGLAAALCCEGLWRAHNVIIGETTRIVECFVHRIPNRMTLAHSQTQRGMRNHVTHPVLK